MQFYKSIHTDLTVHVFSYSLFKVKILHMMSEQGRGRKTPRFNRFSPDRKAFFF